MTGFTSNIGTDADVVLYNADGEVLDPTAHGASMNIKTVRANVQILETKYVPVSYIVSGEPASGYALTGEMEVSPDQILIAGRSSTIASVSEIKVEGEELDITGENSTVTATIDLDNYLPTGISFGDSDFNGTASVIIGIAPITDRTIDVDIRNIAVISSVEGFDIAVDDSEYETVSLTLQGLARDINSISASNVTGSVDIAQVMEDNNMETLKEGTYSADVTFNLPNGVTEKGTVSVYVTVKAKE